MAKNSSNKIEDANPVLLDVLKILWMKQDSFKQVEGDYKIHIDTILKENESARLNKKLALYLISEVGVQYFYKFPSLHSDPDIVIAAIQRDSDIFSRLTPEQMLNMKIAKEYVKSLVREKITFVQIEKKLSTYFPDTAIFQKLFKFYRKYLKVIEHVFYSDLEKQLVQIRNLHPSIYELIFQKWLLHEKGKDIRLWEWFTKFFTEEITKNPNYESLSPEEKKQVHLEIMIRFLWVPRKALHKDVIAFLQSLDEYLHVKQQKNTIDDETDEPVDDTPDESIQTDETAQRLDCILPQYNYTVEASGDCTIQLWNKVKIMLSEAEMQRMTNNLLQKYVDGVSMLSNLGLAFAMRQQERFFSLCGVNPLDWDGLNDGKLLKIFNKVAKIIGIPEKEIIVGYDEDGEHKTEKEIWCFERLDEAKYQFGNIKSSGKINDTLICDPAKKWNHSIVEIALDQDGCYDLQSGAFTRVREW